MSLVSGTASGSNGCRKGDSGRSMWTPGFLPRHLGTRSSKTQKHQDLFAFCFLRFSQELISRELDPLLFLLQSSQYLCSQLPVLNSL